MTVLFKSAPMAVKPEWIDYNGHLNMAYYSVLFDQGVDEVWESFGLGPAYREARGMTTYLAELHIRYLNELREGDEVVSTFQILGQDAKRIHSFQKLLTGDGRAAAEGESLHLSIDQSGPRVAPFPGDVLERIEAMTAAHAGMARPEGAGRVIGIGRK